LNLTLIRLAFLLGTLPPSTLSGASHFSPAPNKENGHDGVLSSSASLSATFNDKFSLEASVAHLDSIAPH
jgi:hypothetical protein